MLGHRGDSGVIQMALAKLFNEQKEHTRVTVSFVELYNEEIHDLLIDEERRYGNHNGVGGLDLREDPIKGPCIAGVTEMPASDVETVMALLRAGNERRTQEPTSATMHFFQIPRGVTARYRVVGKTRDAASRTTRQDQAQLKARR